MNEEMLESRYPIHRACRDGDHSALSSMVTHGKHDLYSEDHFYGWTPIHWAAYYGKLECLQLLISSGVNGEIATQRFHQSPTHVAAFGSQHHCLMWLVQKGANVNAQDYLGETPAHKAARSGSLECLGILKANGASFTVANNNGHFPKDLAISCGNETAARYILQVQEAIGMNGSIHANGICSRKRGLTDMSEEEVKKVRADPSMPFAPPLPQTTEQMMGTDGLPGDVPRLLEAYEEPMAGVSYDSNKLGHLPAPETTTAQGYVCENDVVRAPPTRTRNQSWKYGDCEMQAEESPSCHANTEDPPPNIKKDTPLTIETNTCTYTSPPPSIPRDCGQYQRDFWMECYVPHQAPHRYNLCSDQISNGLTKNGTHNGSASAEFGVRSENGAADTMNGSASAEFGVRSKNGSATDTMNGSGDATSQHSVQPKEYVRVYDYMTNWSAYMGACEKNKTLITNEMEAQVTEMEMEDVSDNVGETHVSNSQIEHNECIVQAQGYDSKLCEAMYDVGYGHAY